MPGARLKGVNTVRKRLASGEIKVYWYHRATGKELPGPPGSVEFVTAWLDAERMTPRDHGTVAALIRLYLGSLKFSKRRDSTQREYRRMLTKLEEEFGTMPIKALGSPRVRRVFLDYQERIGRERAREADNRLSVLSAVFSYAAARGEIAENPLKGFERLHSGDRRDFVWTEADIAAFMEAAPLELQQAMILAIHTGQRYGDLIRLRWSDLGDVGLSLRQRKTGAPICIPPPSGLRRMLDGMERRGPFILTREDGRPWHTAKDDKALSKAFHTHARAYGVGALEFRDLRGTAVVMLAAAGLEVPQIASVTGHTMKSALDILERYGARNQAVARAAMMRLENAPETSFANRLQTKRPPRLEDG